MGWLGLRRLGGLDGSSRAWERGLERSPGDAAACVMDAKAQGYRDMGVDLHSELQTSKSFVSENALGLLTLIHRVVLYSFRVILSLLCC